jgi:hypothetical protein
MVKQQGTATDDTRTPGRAIEWDGPIAHVRLALDEPVAAAPEFYAEPVAERGRLGRLNPLLMLLVGLVVGAAIGFAARPWLMPEPPAVVSSAGSETDAGEAAAPAATAGEAAAPVATAGDIEAATPDPTAVQVQRQAMMARLIDETNHFKGDPDAPVTIIEFSDFQ